ncbi:MAG: tRNA lysidine(34) synthetase TilS [Chloroflexi bacterium]|nr:tRNA lysidine(34) synthetase TilS [Chloroflexota bacterium]
MALLNQVRATIEKQKLIARGDSVVVAVSGGADSLTLLCVLRDLCGEFGFSLHVAHLNHQLRGAESNADAAFVAQIAREWNLPATIESRDVGAYARAHKLSVEEAAREMRYAFLAEVAQKIGARVIAVAHHADDQVETILMHLLRGTGMAGLRGMEYKSQVSSGKSQATTADLRLETWDLALARPLLDVTRAEIETYCQENSLTPRVDSSNLDPTFFRNRVRHEILPYLEKINPQIRDVLRRTARAVADDYAYLQSQVEAAYQTIAREETGAIIFARDAWRALPSALQRGTLRLAFQKLRGNVRGLAWTHIEDARLIALEKNAGARATLPNDLELRVGYAEILIADAEKNFGPDVPLLHIARVDLPLEGVTELPDCAWVVETNVISNVTLSEAKGLVASTNNKILRSAQNDFESGHWSASFDRAEMRGKIFLRQRRAGDRFQPTGMRGRSKSLHEFMIDEKIPRAWRDRVPLLIVNDEIAWVCGWRVDERARAPEHAPEIWRVTFRKK